jgi:predicted nucleic-acid-binding protein
LKALDTNVLVRLLVRDDEAQWRRAERFIANDCSTDDPCLVNRIVLCELVWVLESAYGYSSKAVAAALERVMRIEQLIIEDHQDAWTALREYQEGADFADSLLAAVNIRLGCEWTVTFDKKASKRRGFVLL